MKEAALFTPALRFLGMRLCPSGLSTRDEVPSVTQVVSMSEEEEYKYVVSQPLHVQIEA